MSKFRKKPVVIDAIRNGGEWPPIMDWLDHIAGGRADISFGHRPPVVLDLEEPW